MSDISSFAKVFIASGFIMISYVFYDLMFKRRSVCDLFDFVTDTDAIFDGKDIEMGIFDLTHETGKYEITLDTNMDAMSYDSPLVNETQIFNSHDVTVQQAPPLNVSDQLKILEDRDVDIASSDPSSVNETQVFNSDDIAVAQQSPYAVDPGQQEITDSLGFDEYTGESENKKNNPKKKRTFRDFLKSLNCLGVKRK